MGPCGTTTKITMTKRELLALLFKLDQPNSAKALVRKGEDGKEYYIEAIPDNDSNSNWLLHHRESSRIKKFNKWMEENK